MMYNWHRTRKLGRTVRMLWMLGCARMLGKYVHSGWDGSVEYARYRWRGREWIIPTTEVQTQYEGVESITRKDR